MNASGISHYRSYFHDQADLEDFMQLQADWFCSDSFFEKDNWKVKDGKKTCFINFDANIYPGEKLTDVKNRELLHAIKLSTYLVRSLDNKGMGNLGSGSQQMKHCGDLINLVRWLKLQGINKLSSFTRAVFDVWLKGVNQPLSKRLDVLPRMKQRLEFLSSKELRDIYSHKHTKSNGYIAEKQFFNTGLLAFELGVSDRLMSESGSAELIYLDQLRAREGFLIKTSKRNRFSVKEVISVGESRVCKIMTAVSKMMNQMQVFEALFSRSHRVPNNFFNQAGISINGYAKKVTSEHGKTRNITQPAFFHLMDRAIRWVTDYAQPLMELADESRVERQRLLDKPSKATNKNAEHYTAKLMRKWLATKQVDLKGKPGSPFPLRGFNRNTSGKSKVSESQLASIPLLREQRLTYEEIGNDFGVCKATISRLVNDGLAVDGLSLHKALYHFLPTACLLVIYAFTARRECEVELLKASCCRDTPRGPEINMYSAKGLQEYQWFPTTYLVTRAVEILEILSAPARCEDDQRLLQFVGLTGESFEFWSSGKISEFSEFVGTPNDGKPWVFSEHQYRRFFAMMYWYRYDGGDLATLSWHLRHTDFDMTVEYITDTNMQAAMEDVRKDRIELFIQQAGEVASSSDGIAREFQQLLANAEALSPKRMQKMLDRQIDDIGYVLDFVPSGACFGRTPGYVERAQCSIDGILQPSSASSSMCQGCPNLLSFNHPVTEQEVEAILSPADSPMLRAALAANDNQVL